MEIKKALKSRIKRHFMYVVYNVYIVIRYIIHGGFYVNTDGYPA